MSARFESDSMAWEEPPRMPAVAVNKPGSEIEMECVFRNVNQQDLVAPLRQAYGAVQSAGATAQAEQQCRSALALQEQWNALFSQREQLRIELKRGKELLEQVQKELVTQRACLEEWPSYERICGHNPLPDYLQSLANKERIEQFLPAWLKRREELLQALQHKMERCAKDNGLEHLL